MLSTAGREKRQTWYGTALSEVNVELITNKISYHSSSWYSNSNYLKSQIFAVTFVADIENLIHGIGYDNLQCWKQTKTGPQSLPSYDKLT